jgi:hypothetical protein
MKSTFAWLVGTLGALAAVWGALIAFEVLPDSITSSLKPDWTFSFYAAIVLLLGAICISVSRGSEPD